MTAYQAELSKLEAILNSAVTAIITIDTNGLIESVNPATERMFGYKVSELFGQNVRMLMPEPYRSEHDTLSRELPQPPERRRSSASVARFWASARMEQFFPSISR